MVIGMQSVQFPKGVFMARPKKDTEGTPVSLRLEEAFWSFLRIHPIEEITVNMVAAQARCSRGSFYYHYEDLGGLIDEAIERNFPKDFLQALFGWFVSRQGDLPSVTTEPAMQDRVDKLCLLVGSHSSVKIQSKMKSVLLGEWMRVLGLEGRELPERARILFEFMANGVLGLMSYRASRSMEPSFEFCFGAVFPDIPEAFLTRMSSVLCVSGFDEGVILEGFSAASLKTPSET